MEAEKNLQERYTRLFPYLNEKQRRLVAASDAMTFNRGGISKVSKASTMSRPTITRGIKELTDSNFLKDSNRIRCLGAGRKKIIEHEPGVIKALKKLVEPTTRGDPESPLQWTFASTRNLAEGLKKKGFEISKNRVCELLHELGYSLHGNVKTLEGKQCPERNEQFEYINKQVKKFIRNNEPVISVDTKKKELISNYDNKGKRWQPRGNPRKVKSHDFPDKDNGKAIPYGVYDINKDFGLVNVGCDHDTAAFAVESIKRWWKQFGHRSYPNAKKILICADAGGSNSYRHRSWKLELQKFSTKENLEIEVVHFPVGTSKWNKIEHRLFCHISMKWKGHPLTSHEVVLKLIGSTKTNSGLKVCAKLDKKTYPKGIKVSDEEMAKINLIQHKFHGELNYTILPQV